MRFHHHLPPPFFFLTIIFQFNCYNSLKIHVIFFGNFLFAHSHPFFEFKKIASNHLSIEERQFFSYIEIQRSFSNSISCSPSRILSKNLLEFFFLLKLENVVALVRLYSSEKKGQLLLREEVRGSLKN